jgi:hypothetical protein
LDDCDFVEEQKINPASASDASASDARAVSDAASTRSLAYLASYLTLLLSLPPSPHAQIPCDECVWCTNAGAPAWLRDTGLALAGGG